MRKVQRAPATVNARDPRFRLRLEIRGMVQGVGFRPFVYRLATELELVGWVNNTSRGVFVEVEGSSDRLERFLSRVVAEPPPRASIQSLESAWLDPVGYQVFEVRHSHESGAKTALMLPDIAPCPDCLRELFDPSDRRYRYPFINCTNCGPRFSIIEALPYDRPHTAMHGFTMCSACQAEYDDPRDRRFHAQPNACPRCGPHLELQDATGRVLASDSIGGNAITAAADAIRQGRIVAIKGVGGFQLVVDARDAGAVRRLRERKRRVAKPFALMYPTLAQAALDCMIDPVESRLLLSPAAPIVLLRCQSHANVAANVAPGNPYLGVMLPSSPLHHLLMDELGFAIVATSGNRSEEPICIDEYEALERLADIADLFLIHNRPIVRHVDDSVARVVLRREMVIRRARGYAPLPASVRAPLPMLLATGGQQKNALAFALDADILLSQHIGDLETVPALDACERSARDFSRLYDLRLTAVACDLHPDYRSTRLAETLAREHSCPVVRVQHHYAHVLAAMADNDLGETALGVAWDGTGYGTDGTVWGGEFLHVTAQGFERAAHLRTFRLPGGDKAVVEPRRTALGLLYELFDGDLTAVNDLAPIRSFTRQESAILTTMLARGLNAPRTSSAGRLFDAIAAIADICQVTQFEGQAAMELEFALDETAVATPAYPFVLVERDGVIVIDWAPLVRAVIAAARTRTPVAQIAAAFHEALAAMIVAVAQRVGEERVVLTGGCFQNVYLTKRVVQLLQAAGFRPYWHQRVPPNDGGLALGQIVAAARELREEEANVPGDTG